MMKKLICFSLLLSSFCAMGQFTPGNVVVYRVGDGSAALTSAATAVFLDEYTTSGTLVQSIPLPTAVAGANKRIVASGTATSEGLITRSIDGKYLLFAGYDVDLGTASITSSVGTTVNRIVGRMDANETLDATTALTDFSSGGNPRSVVSTNGTDFWLSGSQGGVRYATLGATTSTQLATTPTNIRQLNIFSGQLYASAQTGAFRLATVGTGVPTTAGQTITNLPGFPTATTSPYGFYFVDLDAGVPGVDVVYVADDASLGFQKYSLVAGVWVSNGNVAVTGNGLRSITATVSGNTVTFFGVNGPSLVTFTDATGYNATIAGTVTSLAPAPTNTAFRGIAFAPQAPAATPSLLASSLTAFGNVCINTTAGPNSFTITGTNLMSTNIVVDPLAGFTYSTTSGGTYTTSLSIPQGGGAFSQDVFVKFTPTAVQSYSGNIVVGGGGASSINVAADGAGLNTSLTVTSGAASSITQTGATVAGTITATGCTAVSAYGIEWSTSNGFANGTGTQVPSSNLTAGDFTANLSGLTANTTYYYHAYATDGAGTSYGSQQSFTTASAGGGGTIVISQAYGGGGGTTGTYMHDYVELHNISGVSQSINGMSLQYGSATGNFGSVATNIFALPNVSIPAGGYYLIQLSAAGSGGVALPVTPDAVTTNLTMSGVSGKVVLANQTTALGCGATATPCALPSSTIVDLVSYGASNNAEGGVTVNNGVALTATQGAVRKNNGCTDTDNNNADFDVVTAPVPRNSASPINVCGAPTPSLSASPLTAFGNVCINTTAVPNSFTITGTNLLSTDVVVDPLPGFTYSTTAGGTYTTNLNIPHGGGAFSQEVFVKFTPTAVQSYNGNIVVGGGGASSVNVAATGSGVNSTPTVTSGSASAITASTATVAGSIGAEGCTPVTAYGIEWSTTSGFANGTGTAVASSNIAGGNFTSDLIGLSGGTTYYYHAYATNAGGTAYGAEQSFATISPNPNITTSALSGFGNVCLGATGGPNSFTITGTNLTNVDINVGPLDGFIFSTTSGGAYTASLILPQPGGSYSQTIYVEFLPTLVQSYNGNIPVQGGGIAAIVNVAATGAGVSTPPTVTTGGSSSITTTTATLAGTISANGCTPVLAYGIEYSLTSGFANGSGTQVASTNITGGNFTSALTLLTPSTTYYYKAYAVNAGGTSYGAEQSFTTASPPPPTLNGTALTGFGNVCINTTSAANSFTLNGTNLTTANIVVGPLAGYSFSETVGGTYVGTLNITQAGGTQAKTVYVKFSPTAVQSYNGNIPVTGGGTTGTLNIIVTGAGVNTAPTVTTGAASNIFTHYATLAGTIAANGCSNVTDYGIEFSGINGFADGAGTKAAGNNLNGGAFSVTLNNLVQGATYYYKAYATNAGGTAYGAQQSFTVTAVPDAFTVFPVPVAPGAEMRFSIKNITAGNYSLRFIGSNGAIAFQYNIHVQSNFINQAFTIPGTMARGVYQLHLVSSKGTVAKQSILIH